MRAPKKPAKKKGISDLPPKKGSDAEGKAVRGGAPSAFTVPKVLDKASPKIG
jgi:hypothetical protein